MHGHPSSGYGIVERHLLPYFDMQKDPAVCDHRSSNVCTSQQTPSFSLGSSLSQIRFSVPSFHLTERVTSQELWPHSVTETRLSVVACGLTRHLETDVSLPIMEGGSPRATEVPHVCISIRWEAHGAFGRPVS